jgi:hypothetical protein
MAKKWRFLAGMSKEERLAQRILAEQWRGEWNVQQTSKPFRELQAVRGSKKRGYEGPLKHLLRGIIDEGAGSFEAVLEVLSSDDHLMVDEFDGKNLTFCYPTHTGDKTKTVTIRAVKKAYKELIS